MIIPNAIADATRFLSCPNCLDKDNVALRLSDARLNAIICDSCHRRYPVLDGVIDFMVDCKPKRGHAQRLCENSAMVFVYQKHVRPMFRRVLSTFTDEEEIKLLKNLERRIQFKKILDMGCGTGKYSRALLDDHRPDLVLAVDISMPMLKDAIQLSNAKQLQKIVYIRADAGSLPFWEHVIDGGICMGALQLFPDSEKALREIRRVCAKSCVFCCLTSGKASKALASLLQRVFSKCFSFRFFDETLLGKYLIDCGFTDVEMSEIGMLLWFHCESQ